MKKTFTFIAILLGLASAPAAAQSYIGSNELFYHTERTPQSNLLNPALTPSSSMIYFTLPGFGFNFNSPLCLSDMLYTTPEDTVTHIDLNRIAQKLSANSGLSFGADIEIFGLGFNFGDNFITLSTRLVNGMNIGLPIEAYNMLSQGNLDAAGNPVTSLTILDGSLINLYSYAETSIGFGHEFTDLGLTVGARVKLLGGILSANSANTNITLNTAPDLSSVSAEVNYSLQAASYLPIDTSSMSLITPMEVTGFLPRINGLAFDLGATYRWNRWCFSAALLNLSKGLSWDRNTYQIQPENGGSTFTFDGLDIVSSGLLSNGSFNTDTLTSYFQDQLTGLSASLDSGARFHQPIPAKLNLGASFDLTGWLTVGALFHGQWDRGWGADRESLLRNFRSSFTLSASANIGNWFEAVVGNSFVNDASKLDIFNPGVGLILTPLSIFQIYLMADYVSSIYFVEAKDINIKAGINILFGNKRFKEIEEESKNDAALLY